MKLFCYRVRHIHLDEPGMWIYRIEDHVVPDEGMRHSPGGHKLEVEVISVDQVPRDVLEQRRGQHLRTAQYNQARADELDRIISA